MSDFEQLDTVVRPLGLHVCPLYVPQPGGAFFLIGSAVAFRHLGEHFLLTATHVVETASGATMFTLGSEGLVPVEGPVAMFVANGPGIDADVAAIRVSPATVTEIETRFRFVDSTRTGEIEDFDKLTLYALLGYPHSKNKPRPVFVPRLVASSTYVLMRGRLSLDSIRGARPLVSGVHEVFHTPRRASRNAMGQKQRIPKLNGMSGGGVWKMHVNRLTGSFEPFTLVGLGIEYHIAREAVVVTRIEHVLRLLAHVPGGV